MSESTTTREHKKIRQWAEERGGHPATVKGTPRQGEDAGLLRIDFDDPDPDENLERIDWDSFFEKFDEESLEFLYQNKTKDGSTSRFCKFVAGSD
jgi:hypothetical protein